MKEKIKNLLYMIYNFPKRMICWIFSFAKLDDNRIFVNCFDGKNFGDNPKAIIDEVLKINPQIRVYWLTNHEKKNTNTDGITYIRGNSFYEKYYMMTSKVWLSNVRMPYYAMKRKKQVYIHTWHAGVAIKKVEGECVEKLSGRYIMQAKHDSSMMDSILSECQDNTELYKKYFWLSNCEILEFGAPRNDIFFADNSTLLKNIKEKYSIEGKRVLLYAPTFRDSNNLECYDIDFEGLTKVLSHRFGGEWIVLLRLHPRLIDKVKPMDRLYGIDVTQYPNIQELLVLADALITDYSSICMDYVNTRRPVFIYAKDIDSYRAERGFHVELSKSPFAVAHDNEELFQSILGFDEDRYALQMDEFIHSFGYYNDGNASYRVAQMVVDKMKRRGK